MEGIGHRRGAAVGAVTAVVVLGLTAVWIGATRPVTEPVRLADGTRVRIRTVVVGRTMHSPYDSPFARLVGQFPQPLQKALGRIIPPSAPIGTGMPLAMGIWLECEAIPHSIRTNTGSSQSAFLLTLNDGRPFRVSALTQTTARLADGRYVEGHFFPVPPATLPTISVSLFPRPSSGSDDPENRPPLTQWTLHPRPLPTPTNWVGEPLPQRRVSEGLEVVLTNLMVNANPNEGRDMVVPASHVLEAWASARFELFESGHRATHWQVERLSTLEDASGGNLGGSQTWQNGSNYIQWRPVLWPGHLWKLGVEFTRVSGFATNEVVAFTNLVVGESQTKSQTTLNGTVSVLRVGETHWDSHEFDLVLSFQPVRQPARLTLLSVSDARGNPVQGSRSMWSDTETTFRLSGTSPTNGPFAATFALQLGRVLEFTAEPTVWIPTTPGPASSSGP